MALILTLNGQTRSFPSLEPGASVSALVASLALQADRIALELNGEIVPRGAWASTAVREADRLELVHFVGGGCGF